MKPPLSPVLNLKFDILVLQYREACLLQSRRNIVADASSDVTDTHQGGGAGEGPGKFRAPGDAPYFVENLAYTLVLEPLLPCLRNCTEEEAREEES